MPDRIDRLLENGLLRGMIEALLADQRRCASVQWPAPLETRP